MYIFSAPILITALKIYLLFSKQRDLTIQNLKYLFSGEGGGGYKNRFLGFILQVVYMAVKSTPIHFFL